MDIFNFIAGVCSILGLLISIFVANKVIKILNLNSNNNNSGTILQGNNKLEVKADHSVNGNGVVNDYRNSNIIGDIDKMPDLTQRVYPVSIKQLDKYRSELSPDTCNLLEQNVNIILELDFLNQEFYESKSQFIGYALKSLPMKDWRSFVNEGYCMIFNYEKTGTIPSFNVEITNTMLGKKIFKRNLVLDENVHTLRIDLSDFMPQIDDWKSVDEICFVFFLNECKGTCGKLKISSIRIEK